MTINYTPEIQSQIYMDKKDGYLLNMVEQLSPKNEYKVDEKEESSSASNNEEEKEPFFKESEFTFTSYMTSKNLDSNIGSTGSFFDTLSSAGGSVTQASQ